MEDVQLGDAVIWLITARRVYLFCEKNTKQLADCYTKVKHSRNDKDILFLITGFPLFGYYLLLVKAWRGFPCILNNYGRENQVLYDTRSASVISVYRKQDGKIRLC